MIVEAGVGAHDVTDGTVRDLATRWLTVTRPSLSPTTLVGYERLLDKVILPRLGPVKLRALRSGTIDTFYSDLLARGGKDGKRLSAQSVRHVHALLRHVLNQGVKWGWLPSNPALRTSPPKVRKKEIVTPDPDAVLLLIAEAERTDPDLAVFLRLAAVTGARRGELCALRWSDIDLVAGSVTIARAIVGERNDELVEKDTKSHAGRRIAIDPETVDVLARHRDRCEDRATVAETTLADRSFIFSPAVDGSRPWRPGGVSLAFIRLRKRAGVGDVPLHSFRHFAATRMLAAGVPVRTVAGRLGHANAATTLNVYSHWVEASDQAAATVLGDLLGNGDKAPTSPSPTGARRTARGAGSRPRSGPKGASP
jgi:integrase